MTTPDPLLERLRRLSRPSLDDVAAARTLARTEAAFAAPQAERRPQRARLWVPAALALWGALYAFSALRELGRLYPAAPAKPAVAVNHRGPSGADDDRVGNPQRVPEPCRDDARRAKLAGSSRDQFMLSAISNVSARTTMMTTIAPPRFDTLRAVSGSIALPVCSDVSSDMEASMQVVACDTRMPNGRTTFGAGRGTFAAPTAVRSAHARRPSHARARTEPASRRNEA
jgi:hypothetical protein